MKKNKEDEVLFRNSRDRHLGISVSNEFYQPVPMFFTREGAELRLIGHYRGSSLFLIANGPSVRNYNLEKLKLPGVMTYGMNNGPRTFRPNFWTCVDAPERFLKSIWLDPNITKFVPYAHFEKRIFDNEKWEVMDRVVGTCPNVIGFRRNEKFMAERFLFEDTINWGNHKDYGGGRSVLLPCLRIAFLLGFRKVYLLGVDFKMSENYTYHFDEQRNKGAVGCNTSTYNRMAKEYMPQLKPYFDAEGYQVFNCNPDSELKIFPYMSFEDAIHETTAPLGDVPNERTWGMYCKPGEKGNWKNEPDDANKLHLATIEPERFVNGERLQNQQSRIVSTQVSQDRPKPKSSLPQPRPNPLPDPHPIHHPQPTSLPSDGLKPDLSLPTYTPPFAEEPLTGMPPEFNVNGNNPRIVPWDNGNSIGPSSPPQSQPIHGIRVEPSIKKEEIFNEGGVTGMPPKLHPQQPIELRPTPKINPNRGKDVPPGFSVSQGQSTVDRTRNITLPDA